MSGEEVREAVRAGGLLAQDRPVVAMISGGRDSVCLLDVAVALCEPGDVSALHVNYGLRAQADGDERHCAALCERLGVGLEVVHERRRPLLDDDPAGSQGNLQAWAREVRYRAASRMAAGRDALIATGHTASDQVETILYRLAASPGRRALLGMAASEGRLIRPLLAVTREQTAAYCEARGLEWREDESNDSEQYARTRVRHGLVGALRAVHPAAEANVLRTAALLREETELLDGLVSDALAGRESIAIARLEANAGRAGASGGGAPGRGCHGRLRSPGGRSRGRDHRPRPPRRQGGAPRGGSGRRGDRARRPCDDEAPAARGLDSRTWPPPRASQPSP